MGRADNIKLARAEKELELRRMRREFAAPGGLIEFIRYFWPVLEPATIFVDGWVLRAICQHLEAVSRGEIKKILFNVPPGFAKSLCVNVFFPAWMWATKGALWRFVSFSYSAHLTLRDNEKARDLVLSRQFQELYSKDFEMVAVGATKISTNKTGWKFASSVGGVGTGERGDIVLLDDPHNVSEAESDVVRTDTVRWFREAMQNRLNSLETGVIIVIMQRVHEGDVSGCIVENYPDYDHFMVPMEFEVGRRCETSIGWVDPRVEEGELAWPERYPENVLSPFKSLDYLWAGQYQQRPEVRGGSIIKREYWKIWDREAMRANDIKTGNFPTFEYVLASLDGAFTEKKENDFSALVIMGAWFETSIEQRFSELFGTPRLMLIYAWQKKLTLHGVTDINMIRGETKAEFEERRRATWGLVEWVAADCKKFKVDKLIIGNKAVGHSVEQEMRRLYSKESFSVALQDPGWMDKVGRAYSVQHLFADGLVWRPDTDWAQLVEDQSAIFPKGSHDDLCDAAMQAITHLRRMGIAQRKDESHAAFQELMLPSHPKKSIIRYEA